MILSVLQSNRGASGVCMMKKDLHPEYFESSKVYRTSKHSPVLLCVTPYQTLPSIKIRIFPSEQAWERIFIKDSDAEVFKWIYNQPSSINIASSL